MNLIIYKKNWCQHWAEINLKGKDAFTKAFLSSEEFSARNLEKHYEDAIDFFFHQQDLVKDINEFEYCLTEESFFENLRDYDEMQLHYSYKKLEEVRSYFYNEDFFFEENYEEENFNNGQEWED